MENQENKTLDTRTGRKTIARPGASILVLLTLVYMFYFLMTKQRMHNENNHQSAPEIRHYENKTLKKVLFWTSLWGSQSDIVQGQTLFLENECPTSNCFVTTNKAHASQSAAIIFHIMDIHKDMKYPHPRLPQQQWIFYMWETPEYTPTVDQYRGIFNATMTYRVDSDIYVPYAKAVRSSGKVATSTKENNTMRKSFKEKKLVAWFASKCVTPGKRELYVKELQKYVQVDIYGRCGNLTCIKTDKHGCHDMLDNNYKFYLSFENALCKDYVTEKAFSILKYNVVPVVYGSTNYTRDLPPGSFINVLDFKSPKQLAAYLKKLDQDEELYMNYFRWKSEYYISTDKGDTSMWYAVGMCALCEYVNKPILQHKVYDDINKWWNTDAHCDHDLISRLTKNW